MRRALHLSCLLSLTLGAVAPAQATTRLPVNDPDYSDQWGLDYVNAAEAWDISTGAGVMIAVIDTGVSGSGDDGLANLVSGYDFVSGDYYASDRDGNGTHVAGIINQSTQNSDGTAGLAYSAVILPIRACATIDSDGASDCDDDDLVDAVDYAVAEGVDVIQLSASGLDYSEALADAVAAAWGAGVFVVAGAGNDGSDTLTWPAAYDGVVAVGALTESLDIAGFSTVSDDLQLLAPGEDILAESFTTLRGGGNYQTRAVSGTSMAAAHVAATAALLMSEGASNQAALDAMLATTQSWWLDAPSAGGLDAAAALEHHVALREAACGGLVDDLSDDLSDVVTALANAEYYGDIIGAYNLNWASVGIETCTDEALSHAEAAESALMAYGDGDEDQLVELYEQLNEADGDIGSSRFYTSVGGSSWLVQWTEYFLEDAHDGLAPIQERVGECLELS